MNEARAQAGGVGSIDQAMKCFVTHESKNPIPKYVILFFIFKIQMSFGILLTCLQV